MKKMRREWITLIVQMILFYGLPLFAGPTDAMGVVVLLLLSTLLLSFLLGCLSDCRIKYAYPAAAALVFLPSVWVYYNDTALMHAVWYLVAASFGLLSGSAMRWLLGVFRW